ncbi:MAG TPA: hypothetical protein VGG88_13800 [Gaiellaceae bacterium]
MIAVALALALLQGVVVRGPTTPVCMTGKPCSEPAVGAVLVFSRDGVSERVRVGAGGRYSVRLAPGTYAVRQAPAPRIGFGVRPDRVRVTRAGTRANFYIDTGIR